MSIKRMKSPASIIKYYHVLILDTIHLTKITIYRAKITGNHSVIGYI